MSKLLSGLGLSLVIVISAAIAADEQARKDATDVRAKIVRVDPDKNVIVIRTGDGDQARQTELRVNDTTRYWGVDRQQMNDGLKSKNFREGADIWYRAGTGDNARTVSELRFFDPATNNNNNNKDK